MNANQLYRKAWSEYRAAMRNNTIAGHKMSVPRDYVTLAWRTDNMRKRRTTGWVSGIRRERFRMLHRERYG